MSTQYCHKCGSILEKGAKFCSECGAGVANTDFKEYETPAPAEPVAAPAEAVHEPEAPAAEPTAAYWNSAPEEKPAENIWQTNAGGFNQMTGPAPASGQKGTILILGAVSIIFSLIFPLASYVCGIVGLVMASKAIKAGENVRNGRLLCIIGLVLAVLNTVLSIVVTVFALLNSGLTDMFSVYLSY